jgi:PEP-CTERM motif
MRHTHAEKTNPHGTLRGIDPCITLRLEPRNMKKRIALIAALLAAFGGTAHAATNLVANGSFEQQALADGTWSLNLGVAGWSISSGVLVDVRNGVAGTASDGKNFIELDSWLGNSGISQTLTTAAGSLYELSFDYSARIGYGAATNPIEVLWNGASISTVTADGTNLASHDWHSFNYRLLGTGSDRLTFRAVGLSDGAGGSLDRISVAVIPEPSTYWLMFGGLGLIAYSLRHRRSRR